MSSLFIDANVPMYLVGASHPNKQIAADAVERAIVGGVRLVTDAEVLQELLHRYRAIGRTSDIEIALSTTLGLVDEVYPVDGEAVIGASRLLQRLPTLSARDAIHVSIMRTHGVDDILTFDTGFDAVGGIRRIPRER